MTVSTVSTQPAIHEHFSARSALPRAELQQAERFIDSLSTAAAKGEPPSADHLQAGVQMLDAVDQKLELVAFNAAVVAGQESDIDSVNRKADAFTQGIEQANRTSLRLRAVLAGM